MTGSNRRALFMAAAEASLQALYPARLVDRGMQDPAEVGDQALRQGLHTFIAEGRGDFSGVVGSESDDSTLRFAIVSYGRLSDESAAGITRRVEQLEEQLEQEIIEWCQARKSAPLDTVYITKSTYSRGLDAPVAWVVMELEALYV
ncbi:hypothetical protein [Paucibacter sp. Y2R2-4]|uniref:hypothetical protein n=1 Tax=Paucibacter sp. Y2R2-4 TaxID=2893553 RepID=UPI0021E4554E|nr:hypothetical protein [Paucibacter sp. Y2R2-4]MCV2349343.1 hypothetical protein [Paucibacter sp. Y2R2-4]